MHLKMLFLIATISLDSSLGGILRRLGCSISVNEHFTNPQPLILLQNNATDDIEALPLPIDEEGTLLFEIGRKFDITCPGGFVLLNGESTNLPVLEAECVSGIKFTVEGKTVPFHVITCSRHPYHVARYTGNKCANQRKEIEVGFNVTNKFIRHITVCFDDEMQNVLYSKSRIAAAIAGYQFGYPRPNFLTGNFYDVKPDSVNYLFSRKGQRKTINKILGLSPGNSSIIQMTGNFFMARGHLTPKADYVFGAQQRLTFWYINVAPQWQTCNGGNWNTMESNSRDFASERGMDLIVYTGTHGILTLPDVEGRERELHLWVSRDGSRKGIPVPALFYKILYESKSKSGIVLLQVNTPFRQETRYENICIDICDKIKWLTWDRKNVTLGYSYCCDVNDFRRTIDVLPHFDVSSLLV